MLMRQIQEAAVPDLASALRLDPPLASEVAAEAEARCRAIERHAAGVSLEARRRVRRCVLVLSGWASEELTLSDGRRQILRLLLPGDLYGLGAARPRAESALQALTDVTVADLTPLQGWIQDGRASATLSEAWRDLETVHSERDLQHLIRLGRLSALERVGHFLLDLHERQTRAGLIAGPSMSVPLTQAQLADHLGLSAVHVHRVLQQLGREDYIGVRYKQITILEPAALAALCQYRPALKKGARGR